MKAPTSSVDKEAEESRIERPGTNSGDSHTILGHWVTEKLHLAQPLLSFTKLVVASSLSAVSGSIKFGPGKFKESSNIPRDMVRIR
jgi:hypothetical protein